MKGPSPPSTVRRSDLRSGSATDHALRADQIGRTAGSVDAASHARCADTPATQIINALRAHLAELGFVAAQGNAGVNELRAIVTDEAERNRPAWWPRSSGTRASYIPALASSSPTCRARPSGSSPSTTSAGRASNGSSKARERSSGRGCHAARSPPTLRPAGWSATTASCAMVATSSSRFAVPKELFHEIRRGAARGVSQLQALAYYLANFMRTVVPR